MIYLNRFEIQFRTPTEAANGDAPAWALTLVSETTDDFGQPARTLRGPLTIEQASDMGYTVGAILGETVQAALADAEASRAQVALLTARCAELETERDAAIAAAATEEPREPAVLD